MKSSSSRSVDYDTWAQRKDHINKERKEEKVLKFCHARRVPLHFHYHARTGAWNLRINPAWKHPRSSSFIELQGLEIFSIYEISANSKTNCPHILGLSRHNPAQNTYRIVNSSSIPRQEQSAMNTVSRNREKGYLPTSPGLTRPVLTRRQGMVAAVLIILGASTTTIGDPIPSFVDLFAGTFVSDDSLDSHLVTTLSLWFRTLFVLWLDCKVGFVRGIVEVGEKDDAIRSSAKAGRILCDWDNIYVVLTEWSVCWIKF